MQKDEAERKVYNLPRTATPVSQTAQKARSAIKRTKFSSIKGAELS
jgi:hypothetical protein